jgi:hypothetical protein
VRCFATGEPAPARMALVCFERIPTEAVLRLSSLTQAAEKQLLERTRSLCLRSAEQGNCGEQTASARKVPQQPVGHALRAGNCPCNSSARRRTFTDTLQPREHPAERSTSVPKQDRRGAGLLVLVLVLDLVRVLRHQGAPPAPRSKLTQPRAEVVRLWRAGRRLVRAQGTLVRGKGALGRAVEADMWK